MAFAAFQSSVPRVLRGLGCFECSRRLWRFRWGEVSWRWGVALELGSFEEGYSLVLQPVFGKWFIKLPRWLPHREPEEMMDGWGFSWLWGPDFRGELHVNWGSRSKVFFPPWRWDHRKTEVLMADGRTWRPKKRVNVGVEEWDSASNPLPDVWAERHPYHYMLDHGEMQTVTATITVERTEWRIRMLRWLPWPRRIVQSIDVWFDGEVGERAGSWKGGCIGCGYTMRPEETPRDTLRRMQRERRFR